MLPQQLTLLQGGSNQVIKCFANRPMSREPDRRSPYKAVLSSISKQLSTFVCCFNLSFLLKRNKQLDERSMTRAFSVRPMSACSGQAHSTFMLLTSIARCSSDPGTSQPLLGFSSGPLWFSEIFLGLSPTFPHPRIEVRRKASRYATGRSTGPCPWR